uniref:Uncharacterized protein n=1 Tax=Geospiza parvula TaxID=87175 RepID=A0A8U8ATN7_GEOPR
MAGGQEGPSPRPGEEEPGSDGRSTLERVVDLLNQAALIGSEGKITILKQVQELIINKDPTLLDNFLDEIIAFQADKSIEVRKFVVGFIEEACKRDIELLLKLVANLNMLLKDENVNVVKKAILTMTQLYKVALQWMVKSKVISELQEACWEMMSSMASDIILLLDSDNDGVRTHAIKFVEGLIVTLAAHGRLGRAQAARERRQPGAHPARPPRHQVQRAVGGGQGGAGAAAQVHGAPGHLQHQPDGSAGLAGHHRPPAAHVHGRGHPGLRDPPW